ncbi:MAG: sigma-70 family RNA polymerase sigma factor [Planctomycetota bacterium]|jgi:RNA polymerase sigma-70 factor (ECF subfamily)
MSSISDRSLHEGLEHFAWLRRLAESLVQDPALASDLALDACQVLNAREADPPRNPRAFLRGVLQRLLLRHHRGEKQRRDREQQTARSDPAASAADSAAQLESQRILLEQVEKLQPAQREVILLRYYHQLSSAEIATRLEIPAATVRKRLQRGLAELRQALDRKYPNRLAWAALLLPSIKPSTAIPQSSLPLAAGGTLLMSKSIKIGFAAIVLVAAGWIAMSSIGPSASMIEAESTNPVGSIALGAEEIDAAPASEEAADRPRDVARDRIAAPGFMQLQVLEANDRAFAEGRVFLVDADASEAQNLTTDAEGLLRLEADGRHVSLVFDRPGSFPHLHEVDLVADQQVLRLPGTAQLGGRLVLNGQAPPEAITLRLDSDHAVISEPRIVELLEEDLGFNLEASLQSAADGSFVFHGLPANWSGTLTLGIGYRRTSVNYSIFTPDKIHFEAPGLGHLIELRAYPMLTGQVVEADGSTVVPNARGWVAMRWKKGASGGFGFDADEEGRFRIALQDANPINLDLRFNRADGSARTEFEPELGTLAANLDLGRIPLVQERRLLFRVVDAQGKPISGAVASHGEGGKISSPSDGSGRGELRALPVGATSVRFAARSYATREVPVPVDEQTRVEVELLPTNMLRIQALQPDGKARGRARLDLVVESWEATHDLTGNYGLIADTLAGRLHFSSGTKDGRARLGFACDEEGKLEIQGLPTNSVLALQMRDGADQIAQELELRPMGIHERRQVEFRLERPMQDLRGRVLDETGNPLVGAKITMLSDTRITFSEDSDATGHFELRNLSAANMRLKVGKVGFATRFLEARPGDQDLHIELSPGRSLLVWVPNESGVKLEKFDVTVKAIGKQAHEIWYANSTEDGAWLLTGLPDHELTLRLQRGKETRDFLVDPRAGELTQPWRD